MPGKLMVTGCGGFVGGAVVHEAGPPWELHAVSGKPPLLERPGLVWHTFDLLDAAALRQTFEAVRPDAVLHVAALADIDACEADPDRARRVNVGVTEELARLARESGAKLVYVSTDTVFDGTRGLYTEDDPPRPLNVYAQTKVAAERVVAALPAPWVVARTSLVMGLPMLQAGNSFLSRIIPVLAAGRELGVPDNEVRSPIDVVTLARALLELAGNRYTGCLHLAGNDVLSRWEMVRRLAEHLGYSPGLVVARNPEAIPGRAPRPLNASLSNARARGLLETPMRNLLEGLELVLAATHRGQCEGR